MAVRTQGRRSSRERRTLFDDAPLGIVVTTPEGRILEANRAFGALVGCSAEALLEQDLDDLLQADDVARSRDARLSLARNQIQSETLEQRFPQPDGSCVTGLSTLQRVRGPRGGVQIVAHVMDITARKQAETGARQGALQDVLTALPTRALFLDRLGQWLVRGDGGAVTVVGVDRFRAINEAFGHGAGDRVITEIARRLERALQRSDTVARIGVDEFAVISDGSVEVVAAIKQAAQPVVHDARRDAEMTLTASVGVRYLEASELPEVQLEDALFAHYRAKELGRDRIVYFHPALRGRATRQAELGRSLRRALERGEIEVHYQAIHEARGGALSGFEALVRWRHPSLGMIAPGEFIPLAETEGLIQSIGAHVLKTSLETLAAWRAGCAYPLSTTMSINVSTLQVRDASHMRELVTAIEASGVPATLVKIELTESVFLDRTPEIDKTITMLKGVGVQLVLDDFGTGWSSLNYLQGLPFDGLKVDRTFVNRLLDGTSGTAEASRCRRVVRAIAGIARELDMHCVAEGVENPEQRDLLIDAGFDYLQGFLFARPVPAQALAPAIAVGA